MTIDLHTHYVPNKLVSELSKRRAPPFIKTNDDGTQTFQMPHTAIDFTSEYTDIENRLEFMNSLSINHQLLSFPGLFGVDSIATEESLPLVKIFNNEIARVCMKYPKKFSGLASLPMADIDLAINEYRRARNDLGLKGVILPNNCFVNEKQANRLSPIFEIVQKIGGHIFIHPGRRPDEVPKVYQNSKPPFPDFAPERLALTVQHSVGHTMVTLLFSKFLDAYPDVSLHVANLGGTLPMVIERMDNVTLTRTPDKVLPSSLTNRFHVDCSSLGPRAIELAVAIFSAEKIVFGTDCPIFSAERSLNAVAEAKLGKKEKKLILEDNAKQIMAKCN